MTRQTKPSGVGQPVAVHDDEVGLGANKAESIQQQGRLAERQEAGDVRKFGLARNDLDLDHSKAGQAEQRCGSVQPASVVWDDTANPAASRGLEGTAFLVETNGANCRWMAQASSGDTFQLWWSPSDRARSFLLRPLQPNRFHRVTPLSLCPAMTNWKACRPGRNQEANYAAAARAGNIVSLKARSSLCAKSYVAPVIT